jgi:hypothetical protein
MSSEIKMSPLINHSLYILKYSIQGPTTVKPKCVSPVCPNITCNKNVTSLILKVITKIK